MKHVGIVVVTFNRKELLEECLSNLLSSSYSEFHIYLIDNGSTDGTKESIQDFLSNPKISYFNTGKNLGGAGGFNYGRKRALDDGVDYIWMRDDDCMVSPDSLSKLISFADEHPNFGYLSSFVKWTDGKPCLRNVQRKSLWKEITSFTENQQIKLASFVSFFTRREVVEDVGLPIKDFFIWGDDWEYSSRVAKKYTSYFVCDSVVTHKCKNNRGCNIIQDNGRLERYFYAYRNEYYFYHKNGFSGHLYEFLKVNYHRLKLFLKGNSKKKRKMIQDGIKAGKSFHPEIEHYYSKNHSTKVLVFFGEPLSYGGQEAFRINRYSNFNDKNIHYTFVTPFHADNVKFRQRIKDKGDNLVHFEYPFESRKRKSYIVKAAKSVLKSNEYDVIHIQSGSVYTLLEVAKLAKKYGVKQVIVHSHAAGFNNFKYRLIKKYSDKRIGKYADTFFACSQIAGEWKFPKEILSSDKYRVIDNGIQTGTYQFDSETRNRIREQLSIPSSALTFIHVGRFAIEKNHAFFYSLLPRVFKQYPQSRFIFVGAGDTKPAFIEKRKELNLSDHILYLENITNVNEVLMAGDIFLFPSLYEGFPRTLVEAQASGLEIIFSDKITKDCRMTKDIYQLPLDSNIWMSKINEIVPRLSNEKRPEKAKLVADKGYDASKSAKVLEDTYLGRN